jgi:hypothetical protein
MTISPANNGWMAINFRKRRRRPRTASLKSGRLATDGEGESLTATATPASRDGSGFSSSGLCCSATIVSAYWNRSRSSLFVQLRPDELLPDLLFDYLQPGLSASSPVLKRLRLNLELADPLLGTAQLCPGFLQHGHNGIS